MQIDFHYYLAYALAKEARYSDYEAELIAYSSQYVDDNKSRDYVVYDDFGRFIVDFPKRIAGPAQIASPITTQGEEVTSLSYDAQKYEYCLFHFVPGDNKIVLGNRRNPRSTEAGCTRAETLVRAATAANNPYLLGISLHTYADTWSHHAFSAFHEDWNCVTASPLPHVGHGEALTDPDMISKTWRDDRFGKDIVNQDRALQATKAIFSLINKGTAGWRGIAGRFSGYIGARDSDARIRMIRDRYGISNEYDKDKWINMALAYRRNPGEIPAENAMPGAALPKPQFVEMLVKDKMSDWFMFQTAAKKQRAWVLDSAAFI